MASSYFCSLMASLIARNAALLDMATVQLVRDSAHNSSVLEPEVANVVI